VLFDLRGHNIRRAPFEHARGPLFSLLTAAIIFLAAFLLSLATVRAILFLRLDFVCVCEKPLITGQEAVRHRFEFALALEPVLTQNLLAVESLPLALARTQHSSRAVRA